MSGVAVAMHRRLQTGVSPIPARNPPVLDTAVLCAEVVREGPDVKGPVFALNEPLHTIAVQPNTAGRLEVAELFLFAQMSDEEAQGTYTFRIEVRSDTGIIIPDAVADAVTITFASHYHPLAPLEHVFKLAGLVFPHPGVYHFHVMCGLASMSARDVCAKAPKLRVVRAEPGGESP